MASSVFTTLTGKDTVVGVCESWDQWTCVPGGSQGCYAECRPYYTLSCDNTNCFIQGRGTNGGRGCQITPSEQSCGFCESAVAQCL